MKKEKRVKGLINIVIIIFLLLLVFWFVKDTFYSELDFSFQTISIEMKVGEKISIDYELSRKVNISWESSNKLIEVSDGVVTANGVGKAIITGTVNYGTQSITQSCSVTTYYGDKGVSLNDVIINGNELYITKGDTYQIPIIYSPTNAYVDAIDYVIANPPYFFNIEK